MWKIAGSQNDIKPLLVACLAWSGFNSPIWALDLGAKPSVVKLSGDTGGGLGGEEWSSESIKKDALHLLLYVAPSQRDVNNEFQDALKDEGFDENFFSSTAVINIGGSWIPEFIIDNTLAERAQRYPKTRYIKDRKKVLVSQWGLADNAYVSCIFDYDGKVIYHKVGKIDKEEIQKVIANIHRWIDLAKNRSSLPKVPAKEWSPAK